MATIGDRIRNARKLAGLTQSDLAKKLNVTQQMIAAYENGKRNPKFETIKKIAFYLHVDPLELIYDKETINFTKDYTNNLQSEVIIAARSRNVEKLDELLVKAQDLPIYDFINHCLNEICENETNNKSFYKSQLILEYDKLNWKGRSIARKRVQELTEIPKYQKDNDADNGN